VKISTDTLAIIYQTINGCISEQVEKGKTPIEVQENLHAYLLALLLKKKLRSKTNAATNNEQAPNDEKRENYDENTLDHLSDEESIEIQLQKREKESKGPEPEGSNTTILIIVVAFLALLVIGGAVTAIIINQKNNTTPASVTKDVETSKSTATESKGSTNPAQSTPDKKSVALKLMSIEKVIHDNHSSQDTLSIIERVASTTKERKLKQLYSVAAVLQLKEAEKRIHENEVHDSNFFQSQSQAGLSANGNEIDQSLIGDQRISKRILL